MKLLLIAATLLASSPLAHARDSAWLLCNDGHIAINSFEHRNGADTRANDLLFIYGGRLLKGSLDDRNDGPVTMVGPHEGFSGTISVDYQKNKIRLEGVLTLDTDYSEKVKTVLSCKVLE